MTTFPPEMSFSCLNLNLKRASNRPGFNEPMGLEPLIFCVACYHQHLLDGMYSAILLLRNPLSPSQRKLLNALFRIDDLLQIGSNLINNTARKVLDASIHASQLVKEFGKETGLSSMPGACMKPCTEQYKTLKIERHGTLHRLLFGSMHVRVEGNRPHSLLKLGVLLCVSEARTQQHASWLCVGIWGHSPYPLMTKQTRYPSEAWRYMPL